MAHANEELIRSGYDAFNRRDREAVINLFSNEIVFHIPGRSQQSGDFSGTKGVAIYFSKVGELSGGTHRLEIHDVLANDEHVTALLRARAERDGEIFDMDVVHVWHVAHGKATELWILPNDQYAFDDFWS